MKTLFCFISLFLISLQTAVAADCASYGKGGGALGINFGAAKILADSTQPNGTILATIVKGGNVTDIKTFGGCPADNVYVIHSTADIDSGVAGVQGMPVYETGIPGIGYQISDITIGTIQRPIPAKINDPVPANTRYFSKGSMPTQVTVWLVKTGPITATPLTSPITVYFLAGSPEHTVGTGNPNSTQLFRIHINMSNLQFKNTSCNVTPLNGSTIHLGDIEVSALSAVAQGAATGKGKDIPIDITCPQSETGKDYLYWFNPISENSSSKDGVLLNAIPVSSGGAQDVGILMKMAGKALKYYNLSEYSISNIKASQSLTLNADYYKLSENITSGEVKGQFELILQEK